jgi:hypothetical protein
MTIAMQTAFRIRSFQRSGSHMALPWKAALEEELAQKDDRKACKRKQEKGHQDVAGQAFGGGEHQPCFELR